MTIRLPFFLLTMTAITIIGCKKEEGPAGKNSLIAQIPEPVGEHCTTGGLRIISGLDVNSNNILDSNEIQKTDYICNAKYDKETILYFGGEGNSTRTGNWDLIPEHSITNFNITNYPADSISFSALLGTTDATAKAFVELYDVTNNRTISNTTLFSNKTDDPELKATTVNFLKDLPKTPITLNYRVRTEKAGTYANCYTPVIKLYKK